LNLQKKRVHRRQLLPKDRLTHLAAEGLGALLVSVGQREPTSECLNGLHRAEERKGCGQAFDPALRSRTLRSSLLQPVLSCCRASRFG
jgi:hypothetical protein